MTPVQITTISKTILPIKVNILLMNRKTLIKVGYPWPWYNFKMSPKNLAKHPIDIATYNKITTANYTLLSIDCSTPNNSNPSQTNTTEISPDRKNVYTNLIKLIEYDKETIIFRLSKKDKE